jgi:hypothetical protein
MENAKALAPAHKVVQILNPFMNSPFWRFPRSTYFSLVRESRGLSPQGDAALSD